MAVNENIEVKNSTKQTKTKQPKIDKEKEEFIVTSNLTNSKLVNYGMSLGYDFSSLTGIPGMVGAGVVGNSSWVPPAKNYGEYVKEIKVFDFEEGKEKIIIPDKEFFSIRNSFLKEANKNKIRFFIKEIVLKAEYIGEEAVKKKYLNQINKRRESLKSDIQKDVQGLFGLILI